MLRKISIIALCIISMPVIAQDYSKNSHEGTIHLTTLRSSWCGNLSISTKVGKLSSAGTCVYSKETPPEGRDSCDPLELNGFLLQKNAGAGFNCAATHVHSNVTGHDGLDEYGLVVDSEGNYVNTSPGHGNIDLG